MGHRVRRRGDGGPESRVPKGTEPIQFGGRTGTARFVGREPSGTRGEAVGVPTDDGRESGRGHDDHDHGLSARTEGGRVRVGNYCTRGGATKTPRRLDYGCESCTECGERVCSGRA